jgi:hypothetical protein
MHDGCIARTQGAPAAHIYLGSGLHVRCRLQHLEELNFVAAQREKEGEREVGIHVHVHVHGLRAHSREYWRKHLGCDGYYITGKGVACPCITTKISTAKIAHQVADLFAGTVDHGV